MSALNRRLGDLTAAANRFTTRMIRVQPPASRGRTPPGTSTTPSRRDGTISARGDGPEWTGSSAPSGPCFQRARGWSLERRSGVDRGTALPVHPGMPQCYAAPVAPSMLLLRARMSPWALHRAFGPVTHPPRPPLFHASTLKLRLLPTGIAVHIPGDNRAVSRQDAAASVWLLEDEYRDALGNVQCLPLVWRRHARGDLRRPLHDHPFDRDLRSNVRPLTLHGDDQPFAAQHPERLPYGNPAKFVLLHQSSL